MRQRSNFEVKLKCLFSVVAIVFCMKVGRRNVCSLTSLIWWEGGRSNLGELEIK